MATRIRWPRPSQSAELRSACVRADAAAMQGGSAGFAEGRRRGGQRGGGVECGDAASDVLRSAPIRAQHRRCIWRHACCSMDPIPLECLAHFSTFKNYAMPPSLARLFPYTRSPPIPNPPLSCRLSVRTGLGAGGWAGWGGGSRDAKEQDGDLGILLMLMCDA